MCSSSASKSFNHQENMSVQCIPLLNPLLYTKTRVSRGIPVFLIFAQKIDCGYSCTLFFTTLKISLCWMGTFHNVLILLHLVNVGTDLLHPEYSV